MEPVTQKQEARRRAGCQAGRERLLLGVGLPDCLYSDKFGAHCMNSIVRITARLPKPAARSWRRMRPYSRSRELRNWMQEMPTLSEVEAMQTVAGRSTRVTTYVTEEQAADARALAQGHGMHVGSVIAAAIAQHYGKKA